jgi:heme oxygenase
MVPDPVSQHPAALLCFASTAVLSRLRLATRDEHEAVERVLDLMSASLTPEGYRQRLEQFYGFYAPLEKALREGFAENADPEGEFGFSPAARSALASRLNKTNHLRQDLEYLGVPTGVLPLCRDLPPMGTQAEVLGCLYVLEGATLGGRMITQHVRSALGITPTTGGRFFEGYGDGTGSMWQGMRQLLVAGSPDTQTENAIVTNAISTFACLRGWCESFQKQLDNGIPRQA